MKKLSSIFALAIVASMLLNVSTYAVYDNGPRNTQYNRTHKVILVDIQLLRIRTIIILTRAEIARVLHHRFFMLAA